MDRSTYEKYRQCEDPELGPRLREFVQIEPEGAKNGYATVRMTGSTCPFLAEKLCAIQTRLGESYLSETCAAYPRLRRQVDGVLEQSLDLSCPEAARLALLDRSPVQCSEIANESQRTILSVLLNRKYAIPKRLILAGHICDKLTELEQSGNQGAVPKVLRGFLAGIKAGLFDAHLERCSANSATQLALVLELIVARIRIDFTSQRYLDLYAEFSAGLDLGNGDPIRVLAERYQGAYRNYYAPFVAEHEYLLENYLVTYARNTVFPLRPDFAGSPTGRYILMAAYFSMAKALMIGLAARHRDAFGVEHAVRVIQSCSRTFEHCTSFPGEILQLLSGKGLRTAAAMSVFTQN